MKEVFDSRPHDATSDMGCLHIMSSPAAWGLAHLASPVAWMRSARWRLLSTMANSTNSADFDTASADTEYHQREGDRELRDRILASGPHLIVLVGPAGSGRRRMAYEAVRSVVGHQRLVRCTTPERLQDFLAHAPRNQPYVVWLGELNTIDGGWTASLLDRLLADPSGWQVAVLAVMDSRRYSELVPCPCADDPTWPASWRSARLLARHGMMVTSVSAASRLDQPTRGDPLLRAAADCLRMGIPVAAESMLRALYVEYLPGSEKMTARATHRAFHAALKATQRTADGWPILTRDQRGSRRDTRYRLGWWLSDGDDQIVPHESWGLAIEAAANVGSVGRADAHQIGHAAWQAGRYAEARTAFEIAAKESTHRVTAAQAAIAAEAAVLAGIATGAAGRPDRAIELLHKTLDDTEPAEYSIYNIAIRTAIAMFRGECGDTAGAITDLRLLRDLCAHHRDHKEDPEAWELAGLEVDHALARWRCAAGEVRPAIELLREISRRYRQLTNDPPTREFSVTGLLGVDHTLTFWAVTIGDAAACLRSLSHLVLECEEDYGADHPITLRAQAILADLYGEQGSPESAVESLEPLIEQFGRRWGPLGFPTLTVRGAQARWLSKTGDVPLAIDRYETLIRDGLTALGEDHPWLLLTRRSLAELLDGIDQRQLEGQAPARRHPRPSNHLLRSATPRDAPNSLPAGQIHQQTRTGKGVS